ncbi:arylsulfatase A-like enzyme [Kordia periserrulae]|uniref:Arylsulfatase A-like enzyme n=1 Tax=Kordia periserrulae TaxID=701523 RepID=A0A2T6C211_9FLAO|nr:sulfatase [Kordia periserrulae]PTX62338.1 arylsulfatase A-like enzyme [Kordia periserrulae]
MKLKLNYIIIILLFSCGTKVSKETVNSIEKRQPNILWIVTEDISPTLSFYGDKTAKTPHLEALANESMIYDNAFAVVGVCGPSRSSIITGMYPTSIGTMHMRTGKDIHSWGKRVYNNEAQKTDLQNNPVIEYSAVIPENVKCYTEYLRINGYFCTNNQKTDYQFAAPVTAWDENNKKAHWRNRSKDTPFFSVFNIGTTHESQLWKKENLPLTVNPKDVKVPPYLPDTEATRNTIARHYSNIELMDAEVGEIIQQLKDDGLYDNTIIFFYSDHGGPLPRQKREIYDSGLKVPFMIKGIDGEKGRTDRMISFVDLAPTMLSLAGIEPPNYMEGKAFLGEFKTQPRDYIIGTSDRFDEFTDRIRAVRTKRYLYLRNDFPELTKYKDVSYRKNIPMMLPFLEMKDNYQLTETQQLWFQTKTNEELYDCKNDPHNVHNLVNNPKYQQILAEMRVKLANHELNRKDFGLTPESIMIQEMWPNFQQPITETVAFTFEPETGNKVALTTNTKGASIGYILSDTPIKKPNLNSGWKVYYKPFRVQEGQYVYAMAQRIGYKESEITKVNVK